MDTRIRFLALKRPQNKPCNPPGHSKEPERERCDETTSQPAIIGTQEGKCPNDRMIGEPQIESDMDMLDAGVASGTAGGMSQKTTCMSSIAASMQRECNMNGK